ncbi:MAG: GAF domain-containing protein [Gammaproteobacteria bacterium]|nr:GAF domain-containing protein [Gammaproteobacteria bacterium]
MFKRVIKIFTFKSIKAKLLVYFLIIGIIPMVIAGIAAILQSRGALSDQAFSQLKSVREIKKAQFNDLMREKKHDMQSLLQVVTALERNAFQKLRSVQESKKAQLEWFFKERISDISILSKSNSVAEAMEQFVGVFLTENKQTGGLAWESISKMFASELRYYHEEQGYHDLLFIDKEGNIVYTARQDADLGQNVLSGTLKESTLAHAFREGLEAIHLQDYAPYAPAANRYIAFLTTPVSRDEEIIGVLALALTHEPVNRIVQRRGGMGRTGESYVVGEQAGRTAYRSDRVVKKAQGKNVIGGKKSGEDINVALAGESGILTKLGSTKAIELSAYAPLDIPGLRWCLLSTIALEDAITPKASEGEEDFFSEYIKLYDYYDLFLIHPRGKIFYTVKQEADYGANLFDEQWAVLELGKVFHEVLESKTFGVSDFAPYGPSNNVPAMFIAQPLLNNGKVELVVAIQLPDQLFDDFMHQRAGMGESGETYLVGADKLMRSNAYRDQHKRSVKASFARPDQGSVDTASSRAALAGESGEQVTKNYLGDSVLSAYTPIKAGNKTWALIAEVKETEAFDRITDLQWLLAGIALLLAMLALLFITRITRSLTNPLLQVNTHLETLARGQLVREEIDYDKNDEIGGIVASARQLKEGIESTIAQANAIAAGDFSKKVKLLSDKDQLGQALSDMTHTLREVTEKNAAEDWKKTGQTQINDLLGGEQDRGIMAQSVLDFLVPYLQAQVGLFYLLEEENGEPRLKLYATYAHVRRKALANDFKLGEGLVGQAARERRPVVITEIPETYSQVRSGMGSAPPRNILAIPFLYEETIKGVIEIGSFNEFTDIQLEFLSQIMPNIAIAVNTSESRTQMQKLLLKT